MDFIWGIDAKELVYERILDLFNGFTQLDLEHPDRKISVERIIPEKEEEKEQEKEDEKNESLWRMYDETVLFKFPTFEME